MMDRISKILIQQKTADEYARTLAKGLRARVHKGKAQFFVDGVEAVMGRKAILASALTWSNAIVKLTKKLKEYGWA